MLLTSVCVGIASALPAGCDIFDEAFAVDLFLLRFAGFFVVLSLCFLRAGLDKRLLSVDCALPAESWASASLAATYAASLCEVQAMRNDAREFLIPAQHMTWRFFWAQYGCIVVLHPITLQETTVPQDVEQTSHVPFELSRFSVLCSD